MEYSFTKQANHCQMHLKGNFTFNDNHKFREIVNIMQNDDPKSVTLDMGDLEFIDSAALGMLLLLKDEAGKTNTQISLTGANGQIKKMLQLSNFDQIFTIDYGQSEEHNGR